MTAVRLFMVMGYLVFLPPTWSDIEVIVAGINLPQGITWLLGRGRRSTKFPSRRHIKAVVLRNVLGVVAAAVFFGVIFCCWRFFFFPPPFLGGLLFLMGFFLFCVLALFFNLSLVG